MDIEIGSLWHDKDHKWTDGADNLNMVHVVLSADQEDDLFLYKTACFMWCSASYCGADIRKFTKDELQLMYCVGNIESIINFKL